MFSRTQDKSLVLSSLQLFSSVVSFWSFILLLLSAGGQINEQSNGRRLTFLLLSSLIYYCCSLLYLYLHRTVYFDVQSVALMTRILSMILNRHHQLLNDKQSKRKREREIDLFVQELKRKKCIKKDASFSNITWQQWWSYSRESQRKKGGQGGRGSTKGNWQVTRLIEYSTYM